MTALPVTKRADAKALYALGLKKSSIADMLGVSRATVGAWLDPDHAAKQKARRAYYSRPCPSCGRPMDGSGGYKNSPRLCDPCYRAEAHENRKWTPEAIIAAIQRFAHEHGRPPWSSEWLYAAPPGCPNVATVQHEFGSWANAVEAAGFERPRIGGYPRTGRKGMGPRMAKVLDALEGQPPMTVPEVAALVGIGRFSAYEALRMLRNRGVVERVGRAASPGRPHLYEVIG